MPGKETRILKVRVLLDVTKTLKGSLRLACPNKNIFEVCLKYEKIGSFYFYCGHLRHDIKACREHLKDMADGVEKQHMGGPWLKAEQFGKRLENSPGRDQSKSPGTESDGTKKQTLQPSMTESWYDNTELKQPSATSHPATKISMLRDEIERKNNSLPGPQVESSVLPQNKEETVVLISSSDGMSNFMLNERQSKKKNIENSMACNRGSDVLPSKMLNQLTPVILDLEHSKVDN
ncbi:hypothetical protein Cni_G06160 [Canna indica]|uniref:Zinc knuckle CX2CX4HX4C domain-containing protein n=1 Tax=Canna indica TaxID=4628 RepID=A0AAQ3JWI1_9LILI|nr:hypothetical protein Cni_G06160 [Canna indica]